MICMIRPPFFVFLRHGAGVICLIFLHLLWPLECSSGSPIKGDGEERGKVGGDEEGAWGGRNGYGGYGNARWNDTNSRSAEEVFRVHRESRINRMQIISNVTFFFLLFRTCHVGSPQDVEMWDGVEKGVDGSGG
ncbi:hypothetical protein BS50DRAFT_398396 [Corynespora cassiicola Philippines]|uniref:Uncharacterized protein n=1 Tax=Corynespora cassiicola Philippines TaxID=1448308 RepID=A0A2T2NK60_CORCC|nr:hypothetical protein BS50DRAFT_398396 [Corynespora cassiicola Philippines]